jgi:hypothetical protein
MELRQSRAGMSFRSFAKQSKTLIDTARAHGLLSSSRERYTLPLPKGISYPLLRLPSGIQGHTASEISHLQNVFQDHLSPQSLTQRLRDSQHRIQEATKRLGDQHDKLLEERQAQYRQVAQDSHRTALEQQRIREQINVVQSNCFEHLRSDVENALRRQSEFHKCDISQTAEALEMRRQQRHIEAEHLLKCRQALELDQEAAREMTAKLHHEHVILEKAHLQKVTDLNRMQCEALGDIRMQQVRTFEDCAQAQADVAKAMQKDAESLQQLAEARREVETDLALQGMFKELELGKHVSQCIAQHVKSAGKSFEADAMHIQEQRESLAKISDDLVLERATFTEAMSLESEQRQMLKELQDEACTIARTARSMS